MGKSASFWLEEQVFDAYLVIGRVIASAWSAACFTTAFSKTPSLLTLQRTDMAPTRLPMSPSALRLLACAALVLRAPMVATAARKEQGVLRRRNLDTATPEVKTSQPLEVKLQSPVILRNQPTLS